MKLEKYLTEIRTCEDQDRLTNELGISDNYFVHLYGNFEDLYHKIQNAFGNSPNRGISEKWESDNEKGDVFSYHEVSEGTTPLAQLGNRFSELYSPTIPHEINGQNPSMWVCFHAVSSLRRNENLADADWKKMASAIASFGDYIIKEKITARFVGENTVDIKYTPE